MLEGNYPPLETPVLWQDVGKCLKQPTIALRIVANTAALYLPRLQGPQSALHARRSEALRCSSSPPPWRCGRRGPTPRFPPSWRARRNAAAARLRPRWTQRKRSPGGLPSGAVHQRGRFIKTQTYQKYPNIGVWSLQSYLKMGRFQVWTLGKWGFYQ
jgi:hypothetical protein